MVDSIDQSQKSEHECNKNLKDLLPQVQLHQQYHEATWALTEHLVEVGKVVQQYQHHPQRINNPVEEKRKYQVVREKMVMEALSEDNVHQTRHLTKTRPLQNQDQTNCMPLYPHNSQKNMSGWLFLSMDFLLALRINIQASVPKIRNVETSSLT